MYKRQICFSYSKTKYKIKYFIGYIYPDTKENVYAVSIINESLNIPIKIDFVGIRLSRIKFLISPIHDLYPFTKLPKSLLYGEEYTFITVSYTHLDVYKRQGRSK